MCSELFNILHNTIYMLLHCIQSVLEVIVKVLLLGALIIRLTCHVKLVCSSRIIVLQDLVQEDIPNLQQFADSVMTREDVCQLGVQ